MKPDAQSAAPLVQMEAIEKHFGGIRAVNGVSLELYPGEVVGVLGHNGAGKSCLMRILSGAMIPNEGQSASMAKSPTFNRPTTPAIWASKPSTRRLPLQII